MQQSRKRSLKIKFITCIERFWWFLQRIKTVRMHFFKVISPYKGIIICFGIGSKQLRDYVRVFGVGYFHFVLFRRFSRKRLLLYDLQDWKIMKWNFFCTFVVQGRLRCYIYIFVWRAFLRLIKQLDITIIISITRCSKPRYFSWFRYCKLYWFSDSFSVHRSLLKKQFVLLLTRINCSWWKWYTRAAHAPNLVTSGQNFHIKFVKSVIILQNS